MFIHHNAPVNAHKNLLECSIESQFLYTQLSPVNMKPV